jgi:hypothetical protein
MPDRRRRENPLTRGVRSAVRNDANAFSYSILITATFGAVQVEVGSVTAARLFLFVLGATGAFAGIEFASSRFFRKRMREERSDIVLLGTALAPISVTAALGAGVGVLQVVDGALAWIVTPALTTAVYVVLAGLQLAFARVYEKHHPPEK